ncbi:MAG: hypothetical protein AB7U18_00275 [Dehalococcoidia bacterium]
MIASRPDPDRLRVSDTALRHVERELYHEQETRYRLEARRRDLAQARQFNPDDPPTRGQLEYSGPTGYRGTVAATDEAIAEMCRILNAIEAVRASVSPELRTFWQYWYGEGRPIHAVCDACGIERATAYKWRRGIVIAVGTRLGWV